METPIIIGLTGSFGSGCTSLRYTLRDKFNYKSYKLSEEIFNIAKKEGKKNPTREQLQDIGDRLRKQHGPEYLAKQALLKAKDSKITVLDGIRNIGEVNYLDKNSDFYLIAVAANASTRWKRVKAEYKKRGLGEDTFRADEKRDLGNGTNHGQQVQMCVNSAAILLHNDKDFSVSLLGELEEKVKPYIKIITGEVKRVPTHDEQMMCIASTNALRSSCIKRQVGAVICDQKKIVASVGFNEVPFTQKSCLHTYKQCYREYKKKKDQASNKYKLLEYCRALHAEEKAILDLSKTVEGGTIYTTTFPCFMCAKKIVNSEVKKVVYIEPYEVEESGELLEESGVVVKRYEGVALPAYDRIFRKG